ncbi:Uncharacterised protein [Achromobacter sp. 2789STDY5608615]|nr:Uncharacterised protein [Achromobacter sp. 2789STDY5608615]
MHRADRQRVRARRAGARGQIAQRAEIAETVGGVDQVGRGPPQAVDLRGQAPGARIGLAQQLRQGGRARRRHRQRRGAGRQRQRVVAGRRGHGQFRQAGSAGDGAAGQLRRLRGRDFVAAGAGGRQPQRGPGDGHQHGRQAGFAVGGGQPRAAVVDVGLAVGRQIHGAQQGPQRVGGHRAGLVAGIGPMLGQAGGHGQFRQRGAHGAYSSK